MKKPRRRYIAANVSTQLMLKVSIEIISTMKNDPDGYRAALGLPQPSIRSGA